MQKTDQAPTPLKTSGSEFLMKIMKAFDNKVGETKYYKYRINLPKK